MTTEPRWLSDDEQALWRLILRAIRKIERRMDEVVMAEGDLSVSDFAVLATLSEVFDRRLRLRDLCVELDWDRSRTSHLITRMERRGLVSKKRSAGDARGVVVQLTEEGFNRLKMAVPGHVESVRQLIFDHMVEEDKPALYRFFGGVMHSDHVHGGLPGAVAQS